MNLIILTYHYFHTDAPYGIPEHDFCYSVSAERFRRDCAAMAESGYEIIRPNMLFEKLGDNLETRGILVSIDDGHDSVANVACEILAHYNISPILSIVPGLVGSRHYLPWSSLRELSEQGFAVESHSMNHRNLTRLGDAELITDLESARKAIEDNVGTPVSLLTVPMGRINRKVVRAARTAGYRGIMTSFTGVNRRLEDAWSLKRFQVKSDAPGDNLDRHFNPLSQPRLIGGLKNLARRVLIGLGR